MVDSKSDGDDNGMRDSGVGNGDWWEEKLDLALNLLSNLYSKLDIILVGASDTLLIYLTLFTDYLNY